MLHTVSNGLVSSTLLWREISSLASPEINASSIAHTAPTILQSEAGWWLGIRLDVMGAMITFFVAALAVSCDTFLGRYIGDNFISPGYLALGLNYSFLLTGSLKFLIRSSAMLEAQMNMWRE
jgi:hypothetical protein